MITSSLPATPTFTTSRHSYARSTTATTATATTLLPPLYTSGRTTAEVAATVCCPAALQDEAMPKSWAGAAGSGCGGQRQAGRQFTESSTHDGWRGKTESRARRGRHGAHSSVRLKTSAGPAQDRRGGAKKTRMVRSGFGALFGLRRGVVAPPRETAAQPLN